MNLSRLFTQGPQAEESGRISQSQSQPTRTTAELNAQIRALTPGQTIRGEVVARNGSEVQIRVSDDMVLNARVDQSIHLEQGKNVTFEVRNNGRMLSLSPLFTNVSADVTVLKALDMAGLPVNETSVEMTKLLMEAGLPVGKSSLQQVYREVNSFPQGEVSDVVDLHRLQMPVNQANMEQMASYRNLTHQLIGGLTDILDALPGAAQDMLAEGKTQETAGLYRVLFAIAGEGELPEGAAAQLLTEGMSAEGASAEGVPVEIPGEAAALQEGGEELPAETSAGAEGLEDNLGAAGSAGQKGAIPEAEVQKGGIPESEALGNGGAETIPRQIREPLARAFLRTLGDLNLSPGESADFVEQIRQFARGQLSGRDFFQMAGRLLDTAGRIDGGTELLHKLFSGRAFREALGGQLKSQWTLQPEEVSRQGKVEELYSRLDRQLKGLARTLEAGGQTESAAYRAVTNVSQNVDFMNQLNQMYAYVQLPLHLRQGDAHGDLYVYTNKRNLAAGDGSVSALLHLDMESLGPVDVYVTLREAKVNTKFYVADDEILDFIGGHMDLLTQRLQKRGYDCSFSMTLREKKEEGGLAPLLQREGGVLLSQYAFDVRT
ncbi:MAG: flagellar hook-length control protein FliK [Roseburia sp.]|nr:flagellar hook-length control protein FliK [Roseburia sp.]MCM1099362.1 flagellar hook-length control protein FliK [Ruminococcus flavefaciens]